MKHYTVAVLLAGVSLLGGCNTSPPPANGDPAAEISYTDLKAYGVDMGCKAALQNTGTPESDWAMAPAIQGTKADYIAGWKQGFEKCRIGLGPVQLPVDKSTKASQ